MPGVDVRARRLSPRQLNGSRAARREPEDPCVEHALAPEADEPLANEPRKPRIHAPLADAEPLAQLARRHTPKPADPPQHLVITRRLACPRRPRITTCATQPVTAADLTAAVHLLSRPLPVCLSSLHTNRSGAARPAPQHPGVPWG